MLGTDYLVEEAAKRGIPTIGVGDGGNEIGMGAISEAVHKHVPHGEILCARTVTDVLLPCGVSNWGCYAIQAGLALLTGKVELLHSAGMERKLIDAAAAAGLVDGNTGKCEIHGGRNVGRCSRGYCGPDGRRRAPRHSSPPDTEPFDCLR